MHLRPAPAAGASRKGPRNMTRSSLNFSKRLPAWIFPLPAVAALFLLMVFPVAYTLWMSLQEWFVSSVTPPEFVGLANYVEIITSDTRFHEALLRTLYFTALAVVVQTILGVGIALVFNREFR